jgi:ADP-ribose pyrophosphatase YjhB (NUDIX family)
MAEYPSSHVISVAFRADKRDGEIVAVFSGDIDGATGELLAYALKGQHCHVTRGYYSQYTRPATWTEYAPLLAELRTRYYFVHIVKRVRWV